MRLKKLIALGLVSVMTMTAFIGCSKDSSTKEESTTTPTEVAGTTEDTTDSSEPVTITFFDKNSGSNVWDDRIAKEVTRITGVNVEIQTPSGDPEEKLALLLAGQDYPDIVLMPRTSDSDITNKYIEAGALLPLNDLIEQYGPDIKEMYGDTLNKIRYNDGKNYYLSNWYGPDPEPVAGFLLRYDYMVEIVGQERADSTEPFTQAEMIDILRQFKEKHPTINGSESIPLIMSGDEKNYFNSIKGMYGMKTYYEKDGELFYDVRDPKYLQMLKFLNGLYTEGLLDQEWVVNNRELVKQKVSSGNVMGSLCAYWDLDAANTSLVATEGENANLVAYKVLGDGVSATETTYGGRSTLGWDSIGITNNCKNVEAAMKLVNFLASEEGQYLLLWGIEGEDWTMENGVHVPNADLVAKFQADYDATRLATGVVKWTWFVSNANGSDGTPRRITKTAKNRTETVAFANLTDTYWDTSVYEGLTPAGNSPDALKYQKVKDIFDQSFAKIVDASSSDEVDVLYNKMIADMEKAGLNDVEKIINENYKARMELWGN